MCVCVYLNINIYKTVAKNLEFFNLGSYLCNVGETHPKHLLAQA